MKCLKKIFLAISIISCIFLLPAVGEKTKISGLYRYVLDNGLSLYVAENHTAPLVYINIAVKAGGIAQTPNTAGIFHLYEHMMFEGNSKYPDGAAVEKSLLDMGAVEYNATTGFDSVNYFFTIPSYLVKAGLDFWNCAIRYPALSEDSLSRQKLVVESEIEGRRSDSNVVFTYNLMRTMFPKYPWKLDPSGPSELVRNATSGDLRSMLQTYYVPNNAALFVGGDVAPNEIYEYVKEIYGDWKRTENPWQIHMERQMANPLSKTEYRVMANEQISPDSAVVRVYYRGPDAYFDEKSIYAATVFDELMADPDGKYVALMTGDNELEIPNADYVGGYYSPMCASGLIAFYARMFSPERNIASRAKLFSESVDSFASSVLGNKDFFSPAQYKQVKQTIRDYNITMSETASGIVDEVAAWWKMTSPDFYFDYLKRTQKVGKKDIDLYLEKYIKDKHPLVVLQVNPAIYEAQKSSFQAHGFTEFTKDTAYWWKQ